MAGVSAPADGLVGVGFSFVCADDGGIFISALAHTGNAALSGEVFVGDELIAVDDELVHGLATPQIIQMVRGKPNTQVVLLFESASTINKEHSKEKTENEAAGANLNSTGEEGEEDEIEQSISFSEASDVGHLNLLP